MISAIVTVSMMISSVFPHHTGSRQSNALSGRSDTSMTGRPSRMLCEINGCIAIPNSRHHKSIVFLLRLFLAQPRRPEPDVKNDAYAGRAINCVPRVEDAASDPEHSSADRQQQRDDRFTRQIE